MKMAVHVGESVVPQGRDGARSSSTRRSKWWLRLPIPLCKCFVEVAHHDDFVHASTPPRKVDVQFVCQLMLVGARCFVVEARRHVDRSLGPGHDLKLSRLHERQRGPGYDLQLSRLPIGRRGVWWASSVASVARCAEPELAAPARAGVGLLLTGPLPVVLRASDSANFYRRLTTDKGHRFGNILTCLLLPASNHFQRGSPRERVSCLPPWHSRLATLHGETNIL